MTTRLIPKWLKSLLISTLIFSTLVLLPGPVSANETNWFDRSFGADGRFFQESGSSQDFASEVLVDSQDRLLVLGESNDAIFLTRWLQHGARDSDFGVGGTAVFHRYQGFHSTGISDAILSDEEIFATFRNSAGLLKISADGELDSSFGEQGIARLGFIGALEKFHSLERQSDGHIVAVGETSILDGQFLVVRFDDAGVLDSGFGSNGVLRLDLSSGVDIATAIAVQSDGRLVVAGKRSSGLAVVRLMPDGTIDSTFGTNGVMSLSNPNDIYDVRDLEIDVSGTIYVGGTYLGSGQDSSLFVTKIDATGRIDNTFGSNGVWNMDLPGSGEDFNDLDFDSQGKLVVSAGTNGDLGLIRLNTDGSPDNSFGNSGLSTIDITGYQAGFGKIAHDSLGRIAFVGGSDDLFVVGRVGNDGSLDSSFFEGYVLGNLMRGDESGRSLAVQSDGKIVIAGDLNRGIFVSRINPDGTSDAGFARWGQMTHRISSTSVDRIEHVVVQSDGRLLLVGTTNAFPVNNQENVDLFLLRLNPDGSIDSTFGQNGLAIHDSGEPFEWVGPLVSTTDDKLFVGHTTSSSDSVRNRNPSLLKISRDGAVDASFGNQGRVPFSFGGSWDELQAIEVLEDGSVLVAGFSSVNGDFDIAMRRLDPNGTVDVSFGVRGLVLLDTGSSFDEVPESLVIDHLGRIVVAGAVDANNMFATRFNQDGLVDRSFGNLGTFVFDSGGTDWGRSVILRPNGRILLLGTRELASWQGSLMVQLTDTGGLDETFGIGGSATVQGVGGDYLYRDEKLFVLGGLVSLGQSDVQILKLDLGLITAASVGSQAPLSPPIIAASPLAMTPAPSPLAYRSANKQVTLRWRAVEGATSYVVTTTGGAERCNTTATSCVIPRLRNGKAYTYLVYSVNADGVRSEAATRVTARPGFAVKRTSLKAKRTLKLSAIVTTKSKGTKTWRITSGSCRIQGDRLVAPTKRGTCRLRLATAKRGSYPAMSTTIKLTITKS